MVKRKVILHMLLLGMMVGCSTTTGGLSQGPGIGNQKDIAALMGDVKGDRLNDPFIRAGLEALRDKDLAAASKAFNRALKFEPANPHLHFLNAMTYHIQAAQGDSSKLDMAKVGYDLALRYDSSNFWAAYQLGQISFSEQRYREAQDAFAYALLFDADNPDILRALAVASYYAQDLGTALGAIGKAAELRPDDSNIGYDLAMINAASGRSDQARASRDMYVARTGNAYSFRSEHLTKRINDWDTFHEQRPYLQLAATMSDIFGKDAKEGLTVDTNASDRRSDRGKAKPDKTMADHKSMVLVDVIIIRSEERNATIKGVNLLSGLSTTLSGTLWSYSDTRSFNSPTTDTRAKAYTINPSFSISASYSLNIFNDNYDKNEILARPTLVALNNKKSEFFSGAVFHVELPGAAGSQGMVDEVPVGIKLEVTPKFWGADEVELKVSAARAFVEGRSAQAGFNNFTQVSKTLVTANVTMKFGDTLVLSGLSEKETENLRDGVPLLQDIPGIQYFFSSENTLEYTKSVLILLTPRKPNYTHEDGTPKIDPQNPSDASVDQAHLNELKASNGWHAPVPNLKAVLWHLKDSKFFKEFRSGDVRMEKWNFPARLDRMTERAVRFLYF